MEWENVTVLVCLTLTLTLTLSSMFVTTPTPTRTLTLTLPQCCDLAGHFFWCRFMLLALQKTLLQPALEHCTPGLGGRTHGGQSHVSVTVRELGPGACRFGLPEFGEVRFVLAAKDDESRRSGCGSWVKPSPARC